MVEQVLENGVFQTKGPELPPPPPVIPPNVVLTGVEKTALVQSMKASYPDRLPMSRPGNGSKGEYMYLLSNHFKVRVKNYDGHFFYYKVTRSSLILLPSIFQVNVCITVLMLNVGTD